MKIVGLGNCRNLRNYVDNITMKNLRKGQSKYYYNRIRGAIFFVVKYKIIHEDYSPINQECKHITELESVINIIMEDYCKKYLRKEKVKKIQYKLKMKDYSRNK